MVQFQLSGNDAILPPPLFPKYRRTRSFIAFRRVCLLKPRKAPLSEKNLEIFMTAPETIFHTREDVTLHEYLWFGVFIISISGSRKFQVQIVNKILLIAYCALGKCHLWMSCTFSLVKQLALLDEWFRQVIRAQCSLIEVSMSLVGLIDVEGDLQKRWILEENDVTAAWEVDYSKLLQVFISAGFQLVLPFIRQAWSDNSPNTDW